MLQSKSSGFSSGGLAGGTVVPQSKILEKVEAQRTEINDLQAKVAGLEAKQIEYEQTLSCVDRQWSQINEDIIYMSRQARDFAINSGLRRPHQEGTMSQVCHLRPHSHTYSVPAALTATCQGQHYTQASHVIQSATESSCCTAQDVTCYCDTL